MDGATFDSGGGSEVRIGGGAAAAVTLAAAGAGVIGGAAYFGGADGAGARGGRDPSAYARPEPGRADAEARALAAERRVVELEKALAASEAERRALEERLGAIAAGRGGPVRIVRGGPGGGPANEMVLHAGPEGPGGAPKEGGPALAAGGTATADLAPGASPDEKLEALIRAFDWDAAGRALAAAAEARRSKRGPMFGDPSIRLEMSKLELAIAEMSRALGASDPEAAYEDLRVQGALAAARLKALGASLDARQRDLLRRELLARRAAAGAGVVAGAAPRTVAEKALRTVQDDLALEEALPSILTPEQYAEWLARAGDDPFLGKPWPRMVMGVDESVDVGRDLAEQWARRFAIGEPGRPALLDIARRFADGMLGVPEVPRSLPARERRLGNLRRAARKLEAQVACERELSVEPTFTPDERARTSGGLGGLFEIVRGGFEPGGPGLEGE
jgi:hypothetical protein